MIRVGRSTDNNVVLYSAVVSRHHVELHRTEAGWGIKSIGTNGTYLDGHRITEAPVTDGMVIRLARSGPNIQINTDEAKRDPLRDLLAGRQRLDLAKHNNLATETQFEHPESPQPPTP